MNKYFLILACLAAGVAIVGAGCNDSSTASSAGPLAVMQTDTAGDATATPNGMDSNTSNTATTTTSTPTSTGGIVVLPGSNRISFGGLMALDRIFSGPTNNASNATAPAARRPATTPRPATTTPTTTVPTGTTAPGVILSATSSLTSYTNDLAEYRESGYYFQFVSCHGNPGSLSIKNGVFFMVDNRDNTAHTLMLAGIQYNLPAYGFTVLRAPSTPGTYTITCDGGGAANLIVGQ